MAAELGPSRHLTWIFTAFVFMQIFNMIAARKINDEFNILEGIHKNFIFIGVWIIIIGGQIIITSVGGIVFQVSEDGLHWQQWLLAVAVGSTSIIINFLLKFWPDDWCPQIGEDSVNDQRRKDKKEASEAKRLGQTLEQYRATQAKAEHNE